MRLLRIVSPILLILCAFTLRPGIAQAVTGDGAVSGIQLIDNNENGYPDRITFNIANPNGETWTTTGAAPYGLSVTQGGLDISISSVTLTTGATANPVGIRIDLNTSDPDLVQNTDGVNDSPIELRYTQQTGNQTCTTCLRDTTDNELGNIAAGDTNGTNTEVDAMKPVITRTAVTLTSTSNLSFNSIIMDYTERMSVSLDGDGGVDLSRASGIYLGMSTASIGAMTTARTLPGFGSWGAGSGGDMTVNSPTVNEIITAFGQNSIVVVMNYASTGYFNAGTTAPTGGSTFTPTSSNLYVFDAAGNGVSTASTTTMQVDGAWDITAPTVTSTYSCDPDFDGDISRMQINYSENVYDSAMTAGVFEADNDTSNDGVGEETASTINTATGGCDGLADVNVSNDDRMRIDLAAGISGTDQAYLNYITGGTFVRDGAGNRLVNGAALGTEFDRAAPVVMSSTPSSNGSIPRTSSLVFNFSEPMDTVSGDLTYTLSGGVSTLSRSWSDGNATLTLSGAKIAGSNTFTFTAAPDANAQTFGRFISTGTSSLSFTATSGSSSSSSSNSSGSSTPTYGITLTSPVEGATYAGGSAVPITWTSTATGGTIGAVNLAYSVDGGATYTAIATNTANNGTYSWTAPSSAASSMVIRIQGTDLVSTLATDSNTISVTTVASGTTTTTTTTEATEVEADEYSGHYLRSATSSTVYYITTSGKRLPFLNEHVFFTYAKNFDDVQTVSDDVLAQYIIGSPIGPKAGTILIKIQSLSDVYVIGGTLETPMLQKIASEELAIALYGSNWADYVLDVPPTMWSHFTFGSTVDSEDDITVDRSVMKKRTEV
jgi:hypothetical protein